jgi:hypothetical protein
MAINFVLVSYPVKLEIIFLAAVALIFFVLGEVFCPSVGDAGNCSLSSGSTTATEVERSNASHGGSMEHLIPSTAGRIDMINSKIIRII